mmetsp:Transcript_3479/g.14375  ORF Transcript_3479/g.14375 Transcript_3479/m.14375 type:complete len:397 (-) Transcript_3479:951-2141(-)
MGPVEALAKQDSQSLAHPQHGRQVRQRLPPKEAGVGPGVQAHVVHVQGAATLAQLGPDGCARGEVERRPLREEPAGGAADRHAHPGAGGRAPRGGVSAAKAACRVRVAGARRVAGEQRERCLSVAGGLGQLWQVRARNHHGPRAPRLIASARGLSGWGGNRRAQAHALEAARERGVGDGELCQSWPDVDQACHGVALCPVNPAVVAGPRRRSPRRRPPGPVPNHQDGAQGGVEHHLPAPGPVVPAGCPSVPHHNHHRVFHGLASACRQRIQHRANFCVHKVQRRVVGLSQLVAGRPENEAPERRSVARRSHNVVERSNVAVAAASVQGGLLWPSRVWGRPQRRAVRQRKAVQAQHVKGGLRGDDGERGEAQPHGEKPRARDERGFGELALILQGVD